MTDPIKTLEKFHTKIENGVTPEALRRFKTIIKTYYKNHGRPFAWRSDTSEYSILVSEIMLQQTQTKRVETKYVEWMNAFPNYKVLARAPLSKVLKVWQGMGYNRRAIALQKAAQMILKDFDGQLPKTPEELITLPHVGPNTAGSIAAFAFNTPTIFIETNIRSVYIAFFFPGRTDVHDSEIIKLVERTLDKKNPRDWYYALMDYGVRLKKTLPNPNKKSKHYSKQSKFIGSNRQIRGSILRVLTEKAQTLGSIIKKVENDISEVDKEKVKKNLEVMEGEGFVKKEKSKYRIV